MISQIAFASGDFVPENLGGVWFDKRDHTARLQTGDVFPRCDTCGTTVVWYRFR